MDLDDLLEELLEGVGRARRHVERASKERSRKQEAARRRQERLRRRVRRAALVGGSATAALMAVMTAVLVLPGSPGVFRLLLALLTGGLAVAAGSAAAVAYRAERRDPRSRASRARQRRSQGRSRRRRPGVAAGTGDLPDEAVLEQVDVRSVPRDVRGDWERLVAARRLVQDLAYDGWVEGATLREVDGLVLRLHRLLAADARTSELGGRSSADLRHQVGDLADLLVALADEAVQAQVQATGTATTVPTTLADARDHLRSLRLARREVEGIDRPGGGTATG